MKELGYSKVVRGDGGIALYLKKFDNRLYYGASMTKFPNEVSLAIGIFDADILNMMSKVEGWDAHNLNIVDFTYKKLVPSEDEHTLEKGQAEGYLTELVSKLNFLSEHMDEIAEEYWTSLSEYHVPKSFSKRLLPPDDMIGLYYGLLNKMVLGQGKSGELKEIINQYISSKRPNAPVKFKIDLVIKHSMSH